MLQRINSILLLLLPGNCLGQLVNQQQRKVFDILTRFYFQVDLCVISSSKQHFNGKVRIVLFAQKMSLLRSCVTVSTNTPQNTICYLMKRGCFKQRGKETNRESTLVSSSSGDDTKQMLSQRPLRGRIFTIDAREVNCLQVRVHTEADPIRSRRITCKLPSGY